MPWFYSDFYKLPSLQKVTADWTEPHELTELLKDGTDSGASVNSDFLVEEESLK